MAEVLNDELSVMNLYCKIRNSLCIAVSLGENYGVTFSKKGCDVKP